MELVYDIIIIGAGPAGLAAGLYAGRSRLNTLILEKDSVGGQIMITSEIENYPGGMECESGKDLMDRMERQVKNFGTQIKKDTITGVELEGEIKRIKGEKAEYAAKTVIIATGRASKKHRLPGRNGIDREGRFLLRDL